jgi:hypothetical protein
VSSAGKSLSIFFSPDLTLVPFLQGPMLGTHTSRL